jgi:hypothetical protein
VILEVYDIAHFVELSIDQKNLFPAAEQRITPWQDDAAVSKCPLCMYVFLFISTSPKPPLFVHGSLTHIPPARPFTHSRTVNTIVVSAVPLSAVFLQSSRSARSPVQCSSLSMLRRGVSRRSGRAWTTVCAALARRRNFSAASGYVAAANLCSHDSSIGRRWLACRRL